MATNTTNYNFKKPDESDFYSIQDQNGNWDKADAALKDVDTPTFEDYSGSMTVPDAATAINSIRSKGKLSTILSNMKAAFKGACLIGQIVNNCVTNNAKLPLSAAQGKALMDLYTQLNSDLASVNSKMPTDLTYITSVMPRIKDIIGIEGQSYQLLSDVAYAISVKGIKSGGFGFNNQLYSDRPVNTSNWGYVEYFQHADNYVTVKLYPESSLDIFIRRFTINTMTWNTDWRKLSTTDVVNCSFLYPT